MRTGEGIGFKHILVLIVHAIHMVYIILQGNTKLVNVNENKIWRKRVRPLDKQGDFESRKLWQHVTTALKIGDINTATEHKKFVGLT